MPVELVPKGRKSPGVSLTLFRLLFHLLLGLALALTVFLVVVEVRKRRVKNRLKAVEEQSGPGDLREVRALEDEVFTFRQRLLTYENLLASHRADSLFFDFLAGVTHRRVSFSKLTLNAREGRAVLSGKTEGLKELREQILLLRKEKGIRDITLKKVALGPEGNIEFSLELVLEDFVLEEE